MLFPLPARTATTIFIHSRSVFTSCFTPVSAYSRPIFTSLFTAAYPSRLFTPVSQVCWVGSCRPDLSSLSRCLYVRAVSHPASHALRATVSATDFVDVLLVTYFLQAPVLGASS